MDANEEHVALIYREKVSAASARIPNTTERMEGSLCCLPRGALAPDLLSQHQESPWCDGELGDALAAVSLSGREADRWILRVTGGRR